MVEYNRRPFQQLEGSRRCLFEKLDKPALMPLPPTRHEYDEWVKARVNLDYHVRADDHYYSVPYRLVKEEVQVRLTITAVEIFHNGVRVASHLRSYKKHQHTTKNEHMPEGHRAHAEWPPERVIRWVGKAGEATAEVAERIMASRPHPELGFRAGMGIKRLGETYGADRLERACRRALAIQSPSYRSVKSILKNGLDQGPLDPPAPPPIEHGNVRGADYYQHN